MARLVLIIANSGTGKSSSMRNLKKDEANVISCSGKELPFQTDIKPFVPKGYQDVLNAVSKATAPIVVIDDVNYLMSSDEMSRVLETGYSKFTQMAASLFNVFKSVIDKDSDQTFYLMAHMAERNKENDAIRLKTTGKMLSEKVVLEGLTNILLTCDVVDGEFVFRVRTDGTGVKTPLGMFETDTVPNDLKLVDKTIREFYK